MIEMISEQFGKINEDYWLPSAKEGDEVGVKFETFRFRAWDLDSSPVIK